MKYNSNLKINKLFSFTKEIMFGNFTDGKLINDLEFMMRE